MCAVSAEGLVGPQIRWFWNWRPNRRTKGSYTWKGVVDNSAQSRGH